MTGKQKVDGPITIGLDIGIASVGWAVLGENRIIDLGVRCFDKAETAKEGNPLNLERRTARLMRRRLRRRAWRLTKLTRLLKREGLIPDVNVLKQKPVKGFKTPNLWKLRVAALDRKLESEELARVIYHLCKHRGFHWISRAEKKAAESDSKSEGGRVKDGLAKTERLKEKYRTAAEMVWKEFFKPRIDNDGEPVRTRKTNEEIFDGVARNKQGDYSKALSRELLADELKLLFQCQREYGNTHASAELETAILSNGDKKSGLFWEQKPALSGENLLKMLGKCTFERFEYRAPKASFSAERHVWLTRLNNLRIVEDGKLRPLNEQERRFALPLPYQQASDFSYKQLRNKLVNAGYLTDAFRFAGLSYPSSRQKEDEKAKDPEAEKLVKFTGWQTLHKTLKDAGLESEWQQISCHALEGNAELLDRLTWVLSVYKDDTEVDAELRKLPMPNLEKMVVALLDIRFDKFSNLSLKALYNILPHMEAGLRYDEACEKAGYHHSQLHKIGEGEHKFLPPFYSGRDKDGRLKFNEEMDIPRNPVVLRALNQARKVVNTIIRKYGSPHDVHIEMARDLSKPFDERREIKKAQEEYRERNEKDRTAFNTEFNLTGELKGKDFEKWQLYREQQGKCAYSIDPIDIHRLFEQGYVEIDHALPYSRSFDNSKNNKVLVHSSENRNKGNHTPYEYLDGQNNSERWQRFKGFVETNKAYRQAKRNRLLKKDFGNTEAKDFRDRNLYDTRYICRFFKNFVERYLQLHEDSAAKRCVVASGQLTSFLRARWGLLKLREESDRHHALDAAVVAACSHGMVKRLADYSRRKELEAVRDGFVDLETGEVINPVMYQRLQEHFPDPWPHFRDELQARLKIDNPALLREEIEKLGSYPPEAMESLRPLFVSRAPQRRNSGAAHKETIYAQPESLKAKGGVTQKVAICDLKLADVDKLVDPHRNEKLYAALKDWLTTRDDREKRAKDIEKIAKDAKRELTTYENAEIERLRALPRKPDKEGNPTGPVVRTVTMVIDKLSGIPVRGGIAKNDTMLRADVFRGKKDDKFYLIPVYVHHSVAKVLPNKAVVSKKDESQWTVMDDNYAFHFSLYPNDLVQLVIDGESILGYFIGVNINDGGLKYYPHDQRRTGSLKKRGVSGAKLFTKFHVDILGNRYPAPPEIRRDLA
ncbi:MAG: type II CRISPR RNA-guided endonuclease Cas9 [Gammaproteobacteria bacterium]|nr:MAG: type II CRISPR RNA-guided endonuclease Cas9 [Gammaproteobacteria bacterium]